LLTVLGVFTNLALVILVDKEFKPHWDSTSKILLFFVLVRGVLATKPALAALPTPCVRKRRGRGGGGCPRPPSLAMWGRGKKEGDGVG
jgi:hypothetical protein